MKLRTQFSALAFMLATASVFAAGVGYEDTPQIPGQKWKVHDKNRPNPPIVQPGASFSHQAPPPADAIVLFDGKDLSKWKGGKDGIPSWKVENGYFEVVKGTGDIQTKEKFGNFQLHFEWSAPNPPKGESQGRGNSGLFLHGLYEIQVLDVYNNKTYADGQAGGLYGVWPPLQNAMKKPGDWNTYDLAFEGPLFDGEGKVTRKASVTLIHNGVVLHHKQEFIGPSGHRSVPVYKKYDGTGPIRLQDHGDPVRFRNIWIRPLGVYDRPE
jgi:Domain of Unknown Function (DUF1080)